MNNSKKSFGDCLRELIRQKGMSQSDFYSSVGITKPYFYDILSGKSNPPPSEMQYKMVKALGLNKEQQTRFLNLAAAGRGEIPADIAHLIFTHPEDFPKIRDVLTNLLGSTEKGE